MAVSRQSKTILVLASVAGVLLVFGGLVAILKRLSGAPVLGPSGWTVPVLAGMLLVVTALLLLERPPHTPDAPDSRDTLCAACGKSIIKEWKLCPHCGELLECDISLPVEGGPTRG